MTTLPQPASPLTVSSVAQLTLSLIIIVGVILALSFVLKRLKLAGPRGRGQLVVIDQVAVGPRERVVLLAVGARQVLIGVSAGGVVGLTPLETPIPLNGPAAPPTAFADRLREFIQRSGAAE